MTIYKKTDMKEIKKALSFLGNDLISEILDVSQIKEVPKGTEILLEGQYVKVIPIVIKGLIKVFSSFDEKELLLYYIQPNESCIMSFAAIIATLYFTNVITGTLGIVLLVLAGVFVLTSFISVCPLYTPFGLHTCPTKEK